ncbi:MAG: hypothetical protein R3F11_26385 [Verrucomicrobiales bacterium]
MSPAPLTILPPGNTTVGVDPARAAVLEIRQRCDRGGQPAHRERKRQRALRLAEIAFAGLTLRGGTVSTDGNGMSSPRYPPTTPPSAQTAVLSGRIMLPQGSNGWTVAIALLPSICK